MDAAPSVKSWSATDLGANWAPPPCTHWTAVGFTTLVTISAQFRYDSKDRDLLRRIGAISQLSGVRYWSTTHQRWRTLISDAYALADPQFGHRRGDFTPDEMKEGTVLYFQQVDNLSGKAIYRMHIEKASADRIVFDIENVGTMRYFFISIVPPGELQSIYYLDRESDHVWRYYSIMRAGKRTNRLAAGNEKSAINRAVAAFRHYGGIPTDQEPPAAR